MRRITELLRQSESTTLDFKQTQYPLAGATDEQKSELIKDILAFANANRTTDAYILLGVKEHKGRPATITGITEHLDDAHLQQLINTKTNRTVQFSYQALTVTGKTIGIIHILRQPRPIYLKNDFGKLRANTVYTRHGSSTSIATPDEISRMGTPDAPTLDLQFADPTERTLRGTQVAITSTVLHTPPKIPDYGIAFEFLEFNREYYREFIRFATFDQLTQPFGIAITNTSTTTAHDLRLTMTIDDPHANVTLALNAPPEPDQLDRFDAPKKRTKRSIELYRTATAWHITVIIPKVQPRQTHYLREPIYIGARTTATLDLQATMYADNLPDPIMTTLTIHITTTERTATLIDALAIYNVD
ncbi:MAG TPA: ATP-binding protein [Thermoanaerobaculia bacterium]|nr:ATP-binding protein [Thermoanaerobaculia bacterium]